MSFYRIGILPKVIFPTYHLAENALSGTNTTIRSKRPYGEFRTLRILTVSTLKHVQTRTQLLLRISSIAARRQAH